MKRKAFWITAVLVMGAVVYFLFNPAKSALFPKCLFFVMTGLKCPGCGSQRAIHSLLHLDILAALGYNAFLVLSLPVIGFLSYVEIKRKKQPSLYARAHSQLFIWFCFTVVIAWWILRNVFNL